MASIEFTGGEKLEQALREIEQRVSNAESVSIGFMEGATYPDGTPVALVAATQNYGAPAAGIPPRPFFSKMVRDKSPGWGVTLGKLLKENEHDATKALGLMGESIKGELQDAIIDLVDPPNAASTIQRKGFDKPLIDTGHMKDSVDYKVNK